MIIAYVGAAFGAGFLASLSPCIYPMLPITIGFLTKQSSEDQSSNRSKKLQVLAFFLGQVISFTALGLAAVKVGEIFGFSSQSKNVNIFVGVMLLGFAYASFSNRLQVIFSKFNQLLPQGKRSSPTVMAGFLFGATSALVASPCTSPVLGGVLGQIASQANFWSGVFQMLAFSMGMGFIFLIAGLGLVNIKKLPKSGNWLKYVHKATTLILVTASGYYFWLAFGS